MQTPVRIGSVLIALFLFFSSSAAEAATREWVGPSGGLWSVGANWSPAGTPVDDDDLVFPVATSAISVNDLPLPLSLQSLRFEGPHTIQGDSVGVSGSIEVLANATIQAPLQLSAGATISGTGAPAPTLAISSTITANGDFTVTGVTIDATSTDNAFTGTMTVGASGTFLVGASGALGSSILTTAGLHLAGGTMRVNVPNVTQGINRLTGDGTLDLGNHGIATMFTVVVMTPNLFTGNIAGSNAVFQKFGAGTLTLGGATTYTGLTYVVGGELVIAHAQALATSTTNVLDGANLTYDVSSTRTMPINLRGAGLNGIGALRLRGGTLTATHTTSLDNGSATVAVAAPHQLVLQGPMNGNGFGQTLSVIGDGTVVLNNATNTLPAAIIGNGAGPGPTLRQGVSGALGSIALTINAGSTLDLGGFQTTLNDVSGTGRLDTGNLGAASFSGNMNFAGTFHGLGSVNSMFANNPVTLAGTHTLSGTFLTGSPHLVVSGTIPAEVRSHGGNVTLEPGSSTGALFFSSSGQMIVGDAINPGGVTTGGLDLISGYFKPMLSGTAPRVTANGGVTITGTNLDLTYAGTIPPGMLTLIANDGTDPISGSFSNALDGSQVTLNGVIYVVDYQGGDGNDLTLTPPTTTYHLSEGATGTFFDTDLLIANPSNQQIIADVTFLPENAAPLTQQVVLAPFSRRTIRVDQITGMESVAFSTIVKPTVELPIAVERTMRWDVTGYGGHTEKATSGPATTWYFAEGSEGFFRTFLLLANPQTTANVAHVAWLREGATAINRTYDLLPSSRTTISAIDDPDLVNQAFGITVTFDQPGVAERAMYFGGPPVFKGGHESAGVTAPSTTWLLAEGATGDGFDTFILVSNPGSEAADVTFTFLPESGPAASITKMLLPNSRITVNPEAEGLPIPIGPVATQVTATKPVIAERAQYWPLGPAQWTEAHNSFGVTEAGQRWVLAEGRVGGTEGYQTYILLANPGNTLATVELTYLGDSETNPPPTRHVEVPPQQRVNVPVEVPGSNDVVVTFGTSIISNQPIVVERAMYWNVNGEIWAAGTNATATRIP